MRRPFPVEVPVCLTIAGSDSGGGAGIQADLKTMEAVGTFGTSAITAVTAQNTRGVTSTHVLPTEEVAAQIRAVRDDFAVRSVKTGMLATAEVIDTVLTELRDMNEPLVVDPVMVAASGDRLLDAQAESAYESLIGTATLVTPNADEASVLTGIEIQNHDDQIAAAEELLETGVDAALIKGGHLSGELVHDVLVTPDRERSFKHSRIDTVDTHGSGCTLASVIAARMALGDDLFEAVESGISWMLRPVRYPIDAGSGPGSVHHLANLRNEADKIETVRSVRDVVRTLLENDISTLIPEVGMNVVGATSYAEHRRDTAAVEGRLHRSSGGVRCSEVIDLGASSHVARFLLAVREEDPTVTYSLNCRNNERIREAITALGWRTGRYDRSDAPSSVREIEDSRMQWAAQTAFADAERTPVAVLDPGSHGEEQMTKLLAPDGETLSKRAIALARAVEA